MVISPGNHIIREYFRLAIRGGKPANKQVSFPAWLALWGDNLCVRAASKYIVYLQRLWQPAVAVQGNANPCFRLQGQYYYDYRRVIKLPGRNSRTVRRVPGRVRRNKPCRAGRLCQNPRAALPFDGTLA